MRKPPAGKEPNPARKDWDNGKGKCDVCGPEPANSREAKYWRQKVYDHGHGYPPAKYRTIQDKRTEAEKSLAALSQIQFRGKLTTDNDGNPINQPVKFEPVDTIFDH